MRVSQLMKYVILSMICAYSFYAHADKRFISNYPCQLGPKTCLDNQSRIVDGVRVNRPCWSFAYERKCDYPSKNDCGQYSNCYSLGQRDCLFRDLLGFCVNIKKEFSCESFEPSYTESEKVRQAITSKDGKDSLICEAIPCFDGNCVDKSYPIDEEMVSSVSQLGVVSQSKNPGGNGFQLFAGTARTCSKSPAGYSNCCAVHPKGWGRSLGASCSNEEKILAAARSDNLCVYVGKKEKTNLGIPIANQHYFCCFANLLEKIIQQEARIQLGLSFGSGSAPNCRALTLGELERIDFNKMDFSPITAGLVRKMKLPQIGDIKDRVQNGIRTHKSFDHNRPQSPQNKASGINQSISEEK